MFILCDWLSLDSNSVVYFDQRTHACACVHMVKNNIKCLKTIKKVCFLIIRIRGSCRAHIEKNVFSWFQPKNHWKTLEIQKKRLKTTEESVSTRFRVRAALKAHTWKLVEIHNTSLFPVSVPLFVRWVFVRFSLAHVHRIRNRSGSHAQRSVRCSGKFGALISALAPVPVQLGLSAKSLTPN